MKKLIVVVDMQNDFIDGALGTQEAQQMLPKLVKKLEQEKEAELIFTLDTHNQYYMDTQEGKKLPVPHCIKPEHGWKITDTLQKFVDKAAFPEVILAVDASCCAGVTPESHDTALAAMKMCQIEIRN